MLILDRYLLRQFIQIFLICFCSLAGLYTVIDAFGNLDDFQRFAGEHGNLWVIMGSYYGFQTILFFDRTSGMLTLIAAMFTLSLFQRYNELIALQAAGVRKWRVIAPIVIAVVLMAFFAAGNREFIMPRIREHFARNAQDLGGENGRDMLPVTDYKTDIILRGKQTYANRQRINKPAFALPQELGEYGKQLIADDAFFQERDDRHPPGYLMTGVNTPHEIDAKPSLKLADEPIILTKHDYPWLNNNECFVVSDVTFELVASSADWRRNASLTELVAGLRNPSLNFGADTRVAIHARPLQPILDVVLLFLGLPLILSRYNRNVFLAIGQCVVLVVGFYMVVLGCQYLGSSYILSPALGAWLPMLIFLPLAVYLSDPLRE
ncbi:MAG TPA: LptF/LptG family permease [Pirellulales bacterium]|jgi:lipopolysaccharide export system permease protein